MEPLDFWKAWFAVMNTGVFSLYWDNIDPAIVSGQKAVFDHFGISINQHRIDGLNHGKWVDWVMAGREDIDVFLFIDIDCIPLSKQRIFEGIQKASQGILYGAEGAAAHIQPWRSYVGAWYAFISRKHWQEIGCPSARDTAQTDVCQNWTDQWKANNKPVELIAPTACAQPKWDLPDRPKAYGTGTTYADDCFHMFEARFGGRELFLEKCSEVVKNKS
jgi:hypothetical protein